MINRGPGEQDKLDCLSEAPPLDFIQMLLFGDRETVESHGYELEEDQDGGVRTVSRTLYAADPDIPGEHIE